MECGGGRSGEIRRIGWRMKLRLIEENERFESGVDLVVTIPVRMRCWRVNREIHEVVRRRSERIHSNRVVAFPATHPSLVSLQSFPTRFDRDKWDEAERWSERSKIIKWGIGNGSCEVEIWTGSRDSGSGMMQRDDAGQNRL